LLYAEFQKLHNFFLGWKFTTRWKQ